MTDLQIFESPEFGQVRVTDQNGQEWYCSADVCRACGIANPRDAVSRLDDDEKITVGNSDGNPTVEWRGAGHGRGLIGLMSGQKTVG